MPATHPSGEPTYVPPMVESPAASTISARPSTPEIGTPAAIDLATAIRSGSTPKCSIANILPVRPMPDCTSSAISTMPCSSATSRSPRTHSAGGTTKPPSPCTGSKMIAATDSGATWVVNMPRSTSSAVAAGSADSSR